VYRERDRERGINEVGKRKLEKMESKGCGVWEPRIKHRGLYNTLITAIFFPVNGFKMFTAS
jgi:hypothetical protein